MHLLFIILYLYYLFILLVSNINNITDVLLQCFFPLNWLHTMYLFKTTQVCYKCYYSYYSLNNLNIYIILQNLNWPVNLTNVAYSCVCYFWVWIVLRGWCSSFGLCVFVSFCLIKLHVQTPYFQSILERITEHSTSFL